MKHQIYWLLSLGLLLNIQCQFDGMAGSSLKNYWGDAKIKQIYDSQTARDTPSLLSFLTDSTALYRERAALALASLQDTASVENLISLIRDPEPSVRAAAIFALGQIGSPKVLSYFKINYTAEFSYYVRQLMLEAWGKCTQDSTLSGLGYFPVRSEQERLGQAQGMFRAGLRGHFNPTARQKMLSFLEDENEKVRTVAAYHFGRFRSQYVEEDDSLLQKIFQQDPNPNVRANLARAIAYSPNSEVVQVLQKQFDEEPDYRVRVNIIRAAREYAYEDVLVLLDEGIVDCNPHVARESARALAYYQRKNQEEAVKTDIEQVADALKDRSGDSACYHPQVIESLAGPLLHDSKKYQAYADLLQEAELYDEVEAIRSMAWYPEQFDYLVGRYNTDTSLVIQSTILEALGQMQEEKSFQAWTQEHPEALLALSKTWKKAIESGDVGGIYYAATALRSETWSYQAMFGDYSFVQKALEAMDLPKDIEAYQELARTLAQWQGQEAPEIKKSGLRGIPWETLERLGARPVAALETSQGRIRIELFPQNAPASVATIVQLLDSGFYDGKSFHRVVANFVAQGGCPRGDGFGGLDFSLPSEFAPDFYDTGSVGLASAGKDTESCQFFITHCPTVHLDGRYTIIGQVLEGMEVVHALQMGDHIQKAYLEKP